MFRDVNYFASELPGRRVFVAIGIDRYLAWPRLSNAVSDVRGALAAFVRLGFEPLGKPLLDENATANALRTLVTDDLASLTKDDHLVLFFAGHGHTTTRTFHDGDSVKTGYIIPEISRTPLHIIDNSPSSTQVAF